MKAAVYRWVGRDCAVSGQLSPDDLSGLARQGFATVVCNRPDGEDPGQPSRAAIEAACVANDVRFVFAPVAPGLPAADSVAAMRTALAESDGAVLAYCRSGTRSAALYAACRQPDPDTGEQTSA